MKKGRYEGKRGYSIPTGLPPPGSFVVLDAIRPAAGVHDLRQTRLFLESSRWQPAKTVTQKA